MKHKRVNKAMACVLAVGMTLAGCGKTGISGESEEAATTEAVTTADTGENRLPHSLRSVMLNRTFESEEINALIPDVRMDDCPEWFRTIASHEGGGQIAADEERILWANLETTILDGTNILGKIWIFRMTDKYGAEIASCRLVAEAANSPGPMLLTEDGGFLVVINRNSLMDLSPLFSKYFIEGASVLTQQEPNGPAFRVIKCDKSGEVQFDRSLDPPDHAHISFGYEENGDLYFFGNGVKPGDADEAANEDVLDLYALRLDRNGTILRETCIQYRGPEGEVSRRLNFAEPCDDGFLLSVATASDGPLSLPLHWTTNEKSCKVFIDRELKIKTVLDEEGRSGSDRVIGERDGQTFYRSDLTLQNPHVGEPVMIMDYGDCYLVVSSVSRDRYSSAVIIVEFAEQLAGVDIPVFSIYDNNGKLLHRTAQRENHGVIQLTDLINDYFDRIKAGMGMS